MLSSATCVPGPLPAAIRVGLPSGARVTARCTGPFASVPFDGLQPTGRVVRDRQERRPEDRVNRPDMVSACIEDVGEPAIV